jgi:hypothetical protein
MPSAEDKTENPFYKSFILEDGSVLNFTKERWDHHVFEFYWAVREMAAENLERRGKLGPGWREFEARVKKRCAEDCARSNLVTQDRSTEPSTSADNVPS